ncbi:protein of unknown function [Candidatus Nitrosacidococcus tergens]|uniref:Uncharacterized protein n=1 Tax=Candidatus Nitrosacidococcus tergens TaxID=553981 RepID=A0A7G1QBI8_9GAMM|nr:protein of unknown function [Candidatus Nitrosacidococcus tergens]
MERESHCHHNKLDQIDVFLRDELHNGKYVDFDHFVMEKENDRKVRGFS